MFEFRVFEMVVIESSVLLFFCAGFFFFNCVVHGVRFTVVPSFEFFLF